MWIIGIIQVLFNLLHLSSALENLALGKSVWEDRPWKGKENWRGRNAVDGRYTDRSAAGDQCVISENKARTATWRVDLGSVVSISHINIYYRTDNLPQPSSYTSRMAGFFLYVSNTTSKEDGHLCYHEIQTLNGTPSEDQIIHCSVQGRYVIYYNERLPNVIYPSYYSSYALYELCELEVYGCKFVGYYGSDCTVPCSTNCQDRRCDVNTGHCLGCLPGYQGPTCDQECGRGYFGPDCKKECGHCLNTTHCEICLSGCSAGYTGSLCKEKCPLGSFGLNCSNRCNTYCAGNESCNHVTGVCDEGCKWGWEGFFCNKGKSQDPHSSWDNNLVVLSIVVSLVIVLTGSVLNYIYWKRKSVHTVQKREVKQLSAENARTKRDEELTGHYSELQEIGQVNTYEEIIQFDTI